jgi:hypothetical protein
MYKNICTFEYVYLHTYIHKVMHIYYNKLLVIAVVSNSSGIYIYIHMYGSVCIKTFVHLNMYIYMLTKLHIYIYYSKLLVIAVVGNSSGTYMYTYCCWQ